MLLTEFGILIISLIILSKASHTVIKSSVKIARITKLGELSVGFLILSMITVLPELTISTTSVISGNFGIAIGNLMGSNITCLFLILGFIGTMKIVKITENIMRRLSDILFLSSNILIVLLILNHLSRLIGLVLIIVYIIFSIYSLKRKITLGDIRLEIPSKIIIPKLKISNVLLKSIFFLIIGMIIVFASSWFAVHSADNIAIELNIDQSFVGATILAIGACLPELTVAVRAQKEGHTGIGLGNTIGSGLTRLTLILGIVLLVSPSPIDIRLFPVLVGFVLLSSFLVLLFLGSFGRKKLDRIEGLILLILYFVFLIVTSVFSYTVS